MAQRARRKPNKSTRIIPRSTILFFVGLALLINEAVLRNPDLDQRPYLIAAFLLMMGFPVAEIADALRARLLDSNVESGNDGPAGGSAGPTKEPDA